LPSTRKNYNYIFVVIDAFTKFVWLYAARTANAVEVLDRLQKQAAVFGSPRRIISDRGTAFTSHDFENYCKEENIEHILITTGVPRANGQVERVNRTVVPLLSKLSAPSPGEWYKYLDVAQKYLNATPSRSTRASPFNLMFGTHMRLKSDPEIREMIENEWLLMFQEGRDEIRKRAKENIMKAQQDNRRSFNKSRKEARRYDQDKLVAIKRTQTRPGLKFAGKYLGPYRITKVLRNDRYIVEKIGEHEGPRQTVTVAEYMKPWIPYDDEFNDEEDETSSSEDGCLTRMAECEV